MNRFIMIGLLCLLAAVTARAEPYLAVLNQAACASCHFNPTGGGLRNTAGNLFAQHSLPVRPIDTLPEWKATLGEGAWDGSLHPRVGFGGDVRAALQYLHVADEGADTRLALELNEALLYLDVRLLPDRLSVYFDQRIAPGGSLNREAYVLFSAPGRHYYFKAGRLFLPYGWRIEDDQALIRQIPGINYTTPDDGIEAGFALGSWQLQAALSNGNAGGAEDNLGKQLSLRAEYLAGYWRVGTSANYNHGAHSSGRRMGNLFAGLATGPVAWLAEGDFVRDDGTARREQLLGYLETSWRCTPGHYLRLTLEGLDPDRDVSQDHRNRVSLSWDSFPIPFVQVRTGLRRFDGIPQNAQHNRREAFLELHALF